MYLTLMKTFLIFIVVACCLQLSAQQDSIIPILPEDEVPDQMAPKEEVPIFTLVQEMPVFPGGEKAMYQYIAENVRYPKEAIDQKLTGVVYVQMIINEDGCVDERINILRGVHPILDEEAKRVVKAMPCWEPGRQRGKPVRVYYNTPFRFSLADDDK
ncbi:MAG: hypothetical protein Salg2KO_04160 [Salibacteraceae bacterium]